MGNCFKTQNTYRSFDESLMQTLNQPALENDINELKKRILQLESKIQILENNTQNNLKSISDDIHFINNTVSEHNNMLKSNDSFNSNLNPTPLNQSMDITNESVYKSVTFNLDYNYNDKYENGNGNENVNGNGNENEETF